MKLFTLSLLLVLTSVSTLANSLIPIASFNQMPMVQDPILSPDGKNIAVITNRDGVTQVSIVPFNNPKKMVPILELGAEKFRIETIYWANDERVLAVVSQPFKNGMRQTRSSHMYSAAIDGSDIRELRKKVKKAVNEGQNKSVDFLRLSPHFLSIFESDQDHILVTMSDKRDNYYSSVFKVNVNTGEFFKYIPNRDKIDTWYVDEQGEVLMAIGSDIDRHTDFRYYYTRQDNKADWELIKKRENYKSFTFRPVLFESKSNSVIIISDYKLYKDALWRFYIATGEYELLAQAPGDLDIDRALTVLEGDKRKVVGFSYTDNFSKRVYFEPAMQNLNKQITGMFAKRGIQAYLYHWDRALNHYLIYTVSDNKPVKFYSFDKSKGKLSPWYGQFPSLSKQKLSKVTPFDFKARDGMLLHGFITLPEGVKNPPLVMFTHGGPYGSQDTQSFDTYVQLFASRGYAVLQVNYRGSGGYGNNYLTSGYAQWGKKMQTDLYDALAWVKNKKLADTNNACAVGISYGGYASLAAAFQQPDQFKCIVSIAGVSDMDAQVRHWRRNGSLSYIRNVVNAADVSLKPISPVHFADKFKAPVLLIHGRVDTSVSFRQSEDMYKSLKKAKKEVSIELFKFGTHYRDDAENRKKSMGLMIDFVGKYLD